MLGGLYITQQCDAHIVFKIKISLTKLLLKDTFCEGP